MRVARAPFDAALPLVSLAVLALTGACTPLPDSAAGDDGGGDGEGEGDAGEGEGDAGEGEGEGAAGEGEGEGDGEPDPDAIGLDERPANATCFAPPRPPSSTGATFVLEEPWPLLQLVEPVFMLEEPGALPARMVVLERDGRVVRFEKDDGGAVVPDVFADIGTRTFGGDLHDENGLLGMAFHPDYPATAEVFLAYSSDATLPVRDRLGRFRLAADGSVDEDSEELVLDMATFAFNHNGGMIAFGRDGYLYWGTGDGGGSGDPLESGQDMTSLLGKVLRIDVDAVGASYAVPPDNPFLTLAGARPEIWATGFRNPWRWSFDRATGELWLGDVGQDRFEEVNLVEGGGNYGWDTLEGTFCFHDAPDAPCSASYAAAVTAYDHAGNGRRAIVGGYVYRGRGMPSLVGTYVYGDWNSGEIIALRFDAQGNPVPETIALTGGFIASFAEDAAGELYVLDHLQGTARRLVEVAGPPPADEFPATLSATGCMDPLDPSLPGPALIPYDVNHAFHSDGAAKERWLALPDGTNATVSADGDIDFPVGTVFVKTFRLTGELVETRLLVRHDDGDWAGYSYAWNADASDATLLPSSQTLPTASGQLWNVPSRAGCLACHTTAAGRSLGLEVAQLNGGFHYEDVVDGGRFANQLTTLSALGIVTGLDAPATQQPRYPALDDADATLEGRARAYLHVNCASCHRPGGTGGGSADFRFTTPLAAMSVCAALPTHGDLGVDGARLLAPGDPARSLVSLRMRAAASSVHRMPPLGTDVVDVVGAGVVDAWIASVASCP